MRTAGSLPSTCRRRARRPGSLPLLTGSFTDYNIRRADQVPDLDVTFKEVLEPTNDLGVKGIGEGGACGASPAVVHAVLNALAGYGVEALEMPRTAEKVWPAVRSADGRRH